MKQERTVSDRGHASGNRPRRHGSAGPTAIALTPPAYGIHLVDRGRTWGGMPGGLTASRQHGTERAPGISLDRGSGSPLPDAFRNQMEHAFDADLRAVRTHQGGEARTVGAEAFTSGNDIHLAPGRYDPSSSAGQELLAHELAHVVQQRAGRVRGQRRTAGVLVNDDPSLEREADRLAALAIQGAPARASGAGIPAAEPVIQRRVGLEFETTVPVQSLKDQKLAYGDLVYQEPDGRWKIIADDSKLEFVTEAMATAGEVTKVVGTMAEFAGHAREVLNQSGGMMPFDALSSALGAPWQSGHVVGQKGVKHTFAAKPQVTIGVELEHLASLLDDAGRFHVTEMEEQQARPVSRFRNGVFDERAPANLESPQHLLLLPRPNQEVDPVAAANQWGVTLQNQVPPNRQGSIPKLVGLMALVLRYLNDGHFREFNPNDPDAVPPYAKSYFPVMSRNDFHTLYQSLGPDKTYFTVDAVLNCWQTPASWAKEHPVLRAGFRDGSKHRLGPTVWDWLHSIIDPSFFTKKGQSQHRGEIEAGDEALAKHFGFNPWTEETDKTRKSLSQANKKDLLSRGEVALNSQSMGLLGMDAEDPEVSGESRLAVLEFRSVLQPEVQEALEVERWQPLAERLFAFARQHNRLKG